jgi:hypothetical protein
VVSLAALFAALAAALLLIARPWEDRSLIPALTIAPGTEIGLAGSTPVAPGPSAAVAQAIAAPKGVAVMAAKTVPAGGSGPVSTIAVAPAQALRPAAPVAPEAPAPTPPPVAEPAPAPVSTPIAAPSPQPATELVAEDDETTTDPSSPPVTGGRPPRVTRGVVGGGRTSRVVRLSGEQAGSELILGDDATGAPTEFREGDEYVLSFSFNIGSMAYGEPGADNVMVEFTDETGEVRSLGLHLWQDAIGDSQGLGRGLWAGGEAAGGDRFLSSVAERTWHDVEIDFRASAAGAGFYAVFLDDQMVDVRGGVSLIPSGSASAEIGIGLLRDPSLVQGTSELRLGPTSLEPLES